MQSPSRLARVLRKLARSPDVETIRGIVSSGLGQFGSPTDHLRQKGSNLRGVLADAVQDTDDEELANTIREGEFGRDWKIENGLPVATPTMTLKEYAAQNPMTVLYYTYERVYGDGRPRTTHSERAALGHELTDPLEVHGWGNNLGKVNVDGDWVWTGQGEGRFGFQHPLHTMVAYQNPTAWDAQVRAYEDEYPQPERFAKALRRLSRSSNSLDTSIIRGLVAQGLDADGEPTEHLTKVGSNLRGVLADAVEEQGDETLAYRIRHGDHGWDWGIEDGLPTKTPKVPLWEWANRNSGGVGESDAVGTWTHEESSWPVTFPLGHPVIDAATNYDWYGAKGRVGEDGSWVWDGEGELRAGEGYPIHGLKVERNAHLWNELDRDLEGGPEEADYDEDFDTEDDDHPERFAKALRLARAADSETVRGVSRGFYKDHRKYGPASVLDREALGLGSNRRGVLADAVEDTGDEELARRIREGEYGVDWSFTNDLDHPNPRTPRMGADHWELGHNDLHLLHGHLDYAGDGEDQGRSWETLANSTNPEAVRKSVIDWREFVNRLRDKTSHSPELSQEVDRVLGSTAATELGYHVAGLQRGTIETDSPLLSEWWRALAPFVRSAAKSLGSWSLRKGADGTFSHPSLSGNHESASQLRS